MTEQEAKVFAQRLTRVWEVVQPNWALHYSLWADVTDFLCYQGIVPSFGMSLSCDVYSDSCAFVVFNPDIPDSYYLRYDSPSIPRNRSQKIYIGPEKYQRKADNWAQPLLPLFRRNCWLSGCPVEASAHEKAEWIQGFSREELESWNLKV